MSYSFTRGRAICGKLEGAQALSGNHLLLKAINQATKFSQITFTKLQPGSAYAAMKIKLAFFLETFESAH